MAEQPMHSGSGSTPVPDPTTLTTAALMREVASLKEIIFTRLDAMDKAVQLYSADLTQHLPADIDKQVMVIKEWAKLMIDGNQKLVDEKFSGVQIQFKERDIAVQAAFAAAKEAVGEQNKSNSLSITKSESATSKQIDAQGQLISTSTAGVNDKIDDIKERLTAMESIGRGGKAEHDQSRNNIALIISLITLVILAFAYFHNAASPTQPQIIYLPAPASVAPVPAAAPTAPR